MIKVRYTSLCYAPELVAQRYVQAVCTDMNDYEWVEVNLIGETLREGTCTAADLPAATLERANLLRCQAFGYAVWPNMCE